MLATSGVEATLCALCELLDRATAAGSSSRFLFGLEPAVVVGASWWRTTWCAADPHPPEEGWLDVPAVADCGDACPPPPRMPCLPPFSALGCGEDKFNHGGQDMTVGLSLNSR